MRARPYARVMDLHDTTRRMRELLLAQDVELSPEGADAAGGYEGRGADAREAWKAFCAVSAEAAFDPVDAWEEGALEEVTHAGFLFEAMFSEGWPGRHGRPSMPEHYELMFTRQFEVGDAGDLMGLHFTIFVPAADELRPLRAEIWGVDDHDPERMPALAQEWIDEVEASPAFSIPMSRHTADRFTFGVDGIG